MLVATYYLPAPQTLHDASVFCPVAPPYFPSLEESSKAVVVTIPSQHRLTLQILSHWQHFRDLKLMFVASRRAEQLSLRSQQRIVVTVEDSLLLCDLLSFKSFYGPSY